MKNRGRVGLRVFNTLFRKIRILPVFIFMAAGMGGNHAYAQRSLNLESLIQQSGMIFAGRVLEVETGTRERRMNLLMTIYTFEVLEHIYGVEVDTLRIKQYGGEADGKRSYPPGVPRFEQGETVLLMLYPTSKIGMTSAVGKGQGKFLVRRDSVTGLQTIANELKNRGLFARLRHPELVADPDWLGNQNETLPYAGFLETVRRIAGELKKEKRKH